MSARHLLLDLFDAALRAVNGRVRVAEFLHSDELPRVEVFAIGKAASAMARGALDALGGRVASALVVTKDGHVDSELLRDSRVTVLEAAHPLPDARSLAAGAALEQRVKALAGDVFPLFLVSGGSSSLVEVLREGATLEDLASLNASGLASGWDIATLNAARSKLSRVKGGGIALQLESRRALARFISDVPGDDVDVIGSGLLGHHRGQPDQVERHVIANVERGVAAVIHAAADRGLTFEAGTRRFDGDAGEVAARFVAALRDTPADGLVWGGESTVILPQRHGRGGRNTHLALAAARLLKPGEPFTILAAGTDGTDGPTEDAGAIVDGGSLERAELAGCDVERAFREFDSGMALECAEDLVHTGPTGTNVGDLLVGIRRSAKSLRGLPGARVL